MTDRIDLLQALAAKCSLTSDDTLAARRLIYADGVIGQQEAELLFRINDAAKSSSETWREFFVEAVTDFVVHRQHPAGYIDQANADWLLQQVARDGRLKGSTELELLVRVQEAAEQAPPILTAVVLHYVESAVTDRAGAGPTITEEEVTLLRRGLFAFSGEGGAASVSRQEAELVFRLNDRARGRPNAQGWRLLFTQAIGHAVLVAKGYQAPSRDEAIRREAWLREGPAGLSEIVRRTFAGFSGAGAAEEDAYRAAEETKRAAQAEAAVLTSDEASWLLDQIGRDGELDDNERAMLNFICEQTGGLPAGLTQFAPRL